MKIEDTFLMISNYNADISWILDYTDNYIIYDRSTTDEWIKPFDQSKVIKVPNIGWDIYDKFTYIIDNYDKLPDTMILTKGNLFKYITREEFDKICNNKSYTPLFTKYHVTRRPIAFYSNDGMYNEINNSWYLGVYSGKYFKTYNEFIWKYVKKIPKYIKFAPGSNYLVRRENILQYPKSFYQQLRAYISYSDHPGEAQIIERTLYYLWNGDLDLNLKWQYRTKNYLVMKLQITMTNFKKILSSLKKKIHEILPLWIKITNNFIPIHSKNKKFPLLESVALQKMCDYSFGDQSGVLGNIPGAYMKKANVNNEEFTEKIKHHNKEIMTLFIDNIRLYKRPIEYSDWLHSKPISNQDRKWLDTIIDEDLLYLCSKFPNQKFVIFTALEDTPLDEYIKDKIPNNVVSINAANAVFFSDKVIPYPHGIERKMGMFYNHHTILRNFLRNEDSPNKLLFVSHRDDTGARGGLKNIFVDKEWATVPKRRLKYRPYLKSIKNHKFVLCPSGNGIESARNWETLYMKRVPVFKKHPYLEEMFKDFPVLFVNDFSEITENLLLENDHLYQKALDIDMDKLNLEKVFKKRIEIL